MIGTCSAERPRTIRPALPPTAEADLGDDEVAVADFPISPRKASELPPAIGRLPRACGSPP